jgi:hypothetical protein
LVESWLLEGSRPQIAGQLVLLGETALWGGNIQRIIRQPEASTSAAKKLECEKDKILDILFARPGDTK